MFCGLDYSFPFRTTAPFSVGYRVDSGNYVKTGNPSPIFLQIIGRGRRNRKDFRYQKLAEDLQGASEVNGKLQSNPSMTHSYYDFLLNFRKYSEIPKSQESSRSDKVCPQNYLFRACSRSMLSAVCEALCRTIDLEPIKCPSSMRQPPSKATAM